MAVNSIRCPVLGAHVTQVTDLEGTVTHVICIEHDALDGTCRLKKSTREGGPLAQLLNRISEDNLNTRSAECVLSGVDGEALVMRFRDRRDAGRQLADKLTAYAGRTDVVVLGLPRGGIPVAHEVATRLKAPVDAFLVRKLRIPE
jgi:hypothetical protein